MTLVAALWLLAQTQAPPPPVDYESDKPPPSAWDLAQQQQQQGQGTPARPEEEGVSLLGQLARTILALLFVVALIYLFSKFALPRLMQFRLPIVGGKAGKVLNLVDRVQLDTKNALVVVELQAGPRLLFAAGEKGVQLIGDLSTLGREGEPGFREAMTRAAERAREQEGGHA